MLFLYKVLIKLGWIKYFNVKYDYVYNGKRIIIPIINGMGKENLVLSEQWMTAVIRHLIALKKGLFIDVGVNVGQTLLKLRSIDADIKYIGFEPNPACVYYTNELIKSNSFKNTIVVPAGIADIDHLLTLNFYTDGDLDSSASIVKDFRPEQVYRREYVACLQYSSFHELLDNEAVSILKIDVEGAELEVLSSLSSVLQDKRPFVLIEILPAYSLDNTQRVERQAAIQEMLKKMNYKILRIHKTELGFSHLERIEINPRIEDCDYLLCPEELMSSVNPVIV
jgi:FkbM family methyltransferase